MKKKVYIKPEMEIVNCEVAGMFGVKKDTKCIEMDFKENRLIKTIISIG